MTHQYLGPEYVRGADRARKGPCPEHRNEELALGTEIDFSGTFLCTLSSLCEGPIVHALDTPTCVLGMLQYTHAITR